MSFRSDPQRRYGHVPPVQYPVGDNSMQNANNGLARQPSFNSGDDSAGVSYASYQQPIQQQQSAGGDELFLPAASTAVTSARGSINHGSSYGGAASTTYNPQTYRSNSASLPYHSSPSARYNSPTAPYGGTPIQQIQTPQQTQTPQQSSYTPATYNPAAYANTNTSPVGVNRGPTYHGYNNYAGTHTHSLSHSQSQHSQHSQVSQYAGSSPSVSSTSGYTSPTTTQSSFNYGGPLPYEPPVGHTRSHSHSAGSVSSPNNVPVLGPAVPGNASAASYSPSYDMYSQQAQYTNGSATSPSSLHHNQGSVPYPVTHDPIPVGPAYADEQNAYYAANNATRTTRSNSHASQNNMDASTYSPTSSLTRHPTNAPLPSRPGEAPNMGYQSEWSPGNELDRELQQQDSLMQQITDMAQNVNMRHGSVSSGGHVSADAMDRVRWQDSPSAAPSAAPEPLGAHRAATNQFAMQMNYTGDGYGFDSNGFESTDEEDEDDALADYGRRQMMEDENDALNQRFAGATLSTMTVAEEDGGSDIADTGYQSNLYGTTTSTGYEYGNQPPALISQDTMRPDIHVHHSYKYGDDENKPGFEEANMDYENIGGLQAPSQLQTNIEINDDLDDDESANSAEDDLANIPDMFYHPGMSNRPLPTIPLLPGTMSTPYVHSDNLGHSRSSSAVSDLNQNQVERASSMNTHHHSPAVNTPSRSLTDAGDARKSARTSLHAPPINAQYPSYAGIDSLSYDIPLPPNRKRKFVPAKMTSSDVRRCKQPWALSGLATWIKEMSEGDESDLKEKTVEDGLVRMFTAKVPTMNIADAETLGSYVVERMLQSEFLVRVEEWVTFGPGTMSGVLWQLTGHGCYAPKLHNQEVQGRCYSYHCARTLKKANLDMILSEDATKPLDWDEMYKITQEMIDTKGKAEAKRQRIVHEVISSEEVYMNQLEVLRVLYRDQLRNSNPAVIPPARLDKFVEQVFGKVEDVLECNKDHLLAQLKYRQHEQGPWVSGVSDLFREWIRKARDAYLGYAGTYPKAELLMRREESRNLLFREFLNAVQRHKRSERLGWTTFLKSPITRLQRYSLLLETVVKESEDGEEKQNLEKAIKEIRKVTMDCDAKVAEVQKEVTINELTNMIVLRPNIHSSLNLDHLGRELLLQGDLLRSGSKNMSWVNTHALLFDHYLILSKVQKDSAGERIKYDVSKEPIPMPLLVLESANDDPIFKKNAIGRPSAPVAGASRTNTSLSTPDVGADDGKVLYPFKIKHLGHEVFTLYAPSLQARTDWCSKITEAKTRHAKALHSQDAEPFRLRVLADSAFAYDTLSAGSRVPGVPIKETPLDRAIRDLESVYGKGRGPAPVCRAQVNCATGFAINGKATIAIGTDFGVFISDATNPRGWQKTVTTPKVTQIAVLEEFSVCILITDRSLISYPLDVVAPTGPGFVTPATNDNPKKAPQKLAKDVSFFAAARMKDRTLLFYKRKEGVHNTFFKVLEPVYHKSTERRGRFFGWKGGAGTTESFRDYDEFYLPVECYSLNLFHSYIAVSTAKGFELLTLDKKQPVSIPDLKQPNINNIANRIRDQKPLGMFRLNEQEFLLAYEDCAVYVDKHGDVSRTLIMEYSGRQKRARAATLCGQYLLLFNEDYVEVRNAENGRLRQIIAGKDVRCLDFGERGPTGSIAVPMAGGNGNAVVSGQVDSKTTVKIAMTHPEVTGMQVVLEMVLHKPGHMEK